MPSHSAMNAYNGNSQQNLQNPILSPINGTNPAANISHNQQQQPPYQQQHPQQHTLMSAPHTSNMPPSRPQSAYYQHQATSSVGANSQPQHLNSHPQSQQFSQHTHAFSASTTNLSGMHQPQPQQLHPQQLQHMTPLQQQQYQQQQQSLTLGNRSKSTQNFQRDMQTQQSLRIQQMMAPSMPNISNMYQQQQQQQQHNSNLQQQNMPMTSSIAASQSMQNVSSVADDSRYSQTATNTLMEPSSSYQQQAQSSTGGQTLRRNIRTDYIQHQAAMAPSTGGIESAQHSPSYVHQQQQQQGNFMTLPPKPGTMQQQQLTPTKQQQQLPPTAPKPLQQNRLSLQQQQQQQQNYNNPNLYQQQQQQPQQSAEDKPPLPPTTTHPLYKATQQITPGMNYVASTLDPPKGGYVPVSASALQQHKNIHGSNPWEREEREKDLEMRREHIRQWREQQINELSSLVHRTPQQEEQLKTLILERDFERRAQELDDPEDESEPSYEKENLQEVFRLSHQQNVIQTPVTNFRQTEIKVASVMDNQRPSINNSNESSPLNSNRNSEAEPIPPPIPTQPPPPATTTTTIVTTSSSTSTIQPKSILKNNRYDGSNTAPSSPSKSQKSASFADEKRLQTEHPISSLARDITHLSLNSNSTNANNNALSSNAFDNNMNTENSPSAAVPPPPPPERNSSYLIMSQQKLRNSSIGLLKTATINSADLQKKSSASSILMNNNNNNIQNNLISMNTNTTSSQQSSPSSSTMDMYNTAATTPSNSASPSASMMLMRDNKRVSFHDEENNYIAGGAYNIDYTVTMEQHMAPTDLNAIKEDTSVSIIALSRHMKNPLFYA